MERGSILRLLLIGLGLFLFMQWGWPALTGKGHGSDERQPLGAADWSMPAVRAPERFCSIKGDRFEAELSTRGASLRHLWLTDAKYSRSGKGGDPIDLVTPSLREFRSPLRTDLVAPFTDPSKEQLAYHDVDWTLGASDGHSCAFTYLADAKGQPVARREDAATAVTKTIAATSKPFELSIDMKVENLGAEPKKHRATLEEDTWRTKKETEGSLGRQSELLTEVVASADAKVERHGPGDFAPSDFKKKEFTPEKWRRALGDAHWVATSSSYFSEVAIPLDGPAPPAAETLIEEDWDTHLSKSNDPNYGHVYRARIAWPEIELKPGASATYKALAYAGPKERDVLAAVDHGISDVINLGWFSPIAKVLVWYVRQLEHLVGSWGWAIVLLTITVRMGLFPLTLSQIKNSIVMRRLKPEMDVINAKFKDDATQRGLAMQELWRKHKVNPAVGCVPVLLQMPVWFALYTALQTAVELYHTPFGPFIPDLSAPGKYYIIPILLGGSSFIQQKLMPPQGDPAQQKMMMYMMPGIFTVMMLFLPAGLGVYMMTNTWLGILQQVLMERYMAAGAPPSSGIEVREKKTPGDDTSPPSLGKGKASVRG
jgi:YidC/Oxa1 family membrane protein insertase